MNQCQQCGTNWRGDLKRPHICVGGVGAQLAKLIKLKLGVPPCKPCKSLIRKMNEQGPDWCEENKRDLAARMVANSKRMRKKLSDGDNELQLTDDEQRRLKRLKYVPTKIQMYGAVKLIEEAIHQHRIQLSA